LSAPATIICGKPIDSVTPLATPNSTGFSGEAANVPPSSRLRPKRASFRSVAPNMCVALTVRTLRDGCDAEPNPGMLLPCAVGSSERTNCVP
jgi:hypothetical protein